MQDHGLRSNHRPDCLSPEGLLIIANDDLYTHILAMRLDDHGIM